MLERLYLTQIIDFSFQGMTTEEAKKLVTDNGGEIYVRQVSSMERTLEVMPRMKKRYSFKKEYPSEFKFRCKCLILFQNLDGVDVILFGLYVYEHDESNAPPNQRAVYISYLDSIYYMRPRKMRTFVYHELLTSYLDYVRNKGYSTAHIWACPPLKGDDYILFAKPEDQKIPKDERLRQWYIDMLQECQRRGIVGKMTNAYDLYFANPKNDATALPYMEGDYFPGELENIIKDIDEGKNLSKKPDKSGKGKKDGKKKKKAKKGGREGTRSGGLDTDLLAASGIQPEGVDVKSLQEGGRDYVMQRLGETINRMKDNFIVAYLNWEGQSPENMVVPKDIMEYREKHGIKALKSEEAKVKIEELDEKEDGDSTKAPVKVESADTSKESPPSTDAASDAKPVAGEDKSDADGKEEEKAAAAVVKEEAKAKGDTEEAKPEEAAKENGDAKGNEVAKETEANDAEEKQDEKDDETSSKPEEEAKSENEKAEGDDAKEKPDAVMSEANGEEGKDEEKKSEDVEESNGEKKPEGEAKEEEKTPEGEALKEEEKPEGETVEEEKKPEGEAVEEEKKPEGEAVKEEEKPEGEAAKEEEKSEGEAAKVKEEEKSEAEEVSDEKKSGDEEGKDEKPEGEAKSADASAVKTEENKDGESKDVEMKDGDAKDVETKDGEAKDTEMKDAQSKPASQSPAREGKFAAMEKRKKELGGGDDPKPEEAKSKPEETPSKGPTMTKDSKGRLVKIIDDDEEEMDCEFLNNRQLFLNLCQGNHYQFDSLRRAKHTSMMVLWHLHNRDAPKFVQQCAICSREILQGYRFHCPTCADFDMCQDCRRNPNIPPHPHPLQTLRVGSEQSALTPEQRKERQRSIQLHMTLLLHASTCRSQECQSANCAKMKGLLKHGTTCKVKANGGCNVCKRIWALLQIHAKQCKQENCPVPNCMAIRERYRQLRLQQQAMDDRRRQMMNQTYHQKAR